MWGGKCGKVESIPLEPAILPSRGGNGEIIAYERDSIAAAG